jgi:hypothetical protein
MDTDTLIQRLAQDTTAVRPLPRPWLRTGLWLALAIPYVVLVVLAVTPREDLATKVADSRYVIEQLAAVTTGIAAAAAAFASVIPGVNRKFLFVPLVPMAVWLGSLGEGCVETWLRSVTGGFFFETDWICFPSIVLVGAVPAIAMAVMLRRGAPLTPHVTAALGGLAAAGLGNFGLRFFHPQDASLMVLVWQVGSVIVLSVLAGWAGRYVLSWRSAIGALRTGVAAD